VVTMLASMALAPHVPSDPKQESAERDSRDKAAKWLSKNTPNDTTQAAAFRLLVQVRAGAAAKTLQAEIDQLLARQNKDGGWSQLTHLPSDAYATGQALYVLNLAGVKKDRPEIQRGAAFLAASQKDDGSWPMKMRSHPEAKVGSNSVPITYFGSAWGTL